MKTFTKASTVMKKYTMSIALVLVFIFFSILTNGRLLYAQNVSNLLLQNAYVLVMACGMLLCILTGGNIDLSVGSTLCLVAAVAAQLMDKASMSAFVTILLAIMISAVIGVWQGFWIGYIHVPPFIATLAGMFLFRGLGRVVLASKTVNIQNNSFLNAFISYVDVPGLDSKWSHPSALIAGIAVAVLLTVLMLISRAKKVQKNYEVDSMVSTIIKIVIIDALIIAYCWKLSNYKGIPVMLLWILLVVLIFAFITMKTAFGRYFYAVGGNEKAAKLSGIDPRRVYFWAYFLMSVLAGFSGLLMAARIGAVDGNMGNAYEMDAIAACFIGGASAYGGSGTVSGIMVGAILLGVMNQGMSIYGLPDEWQYVVKGAVLLAAVIFDVVSNHKVGKQ
ncbi:MAG: sugar ABC transporter permease [Oscillospiraceae bacterium]|jgi:putative multiple sugar transport system permease protein|nr:sugar ABC transporter permease [Oscillospiraceae bacterium]